MDNKEKKDDRSKLTTPLTIPNSEDCLDYVQPDGVNEDGSVNVKTERGGVTSKSDSAGNNSSTKRDEKKLPISERS